MRYLIILLMMAFAVTLYADDKQADRYVREAEYYQKQAEGYRRQAEYYLKRAESYQREAAYYTKQGRTDRASDYTGYAKRAMDDYKTQLRYAANADDKAADYLRKAAAALKR